MRAGRHYLIGIATTAALWLGSGSTARASSGLLPPSTVHETLDNGLEVVVIPLATPGLVALQTWMDVGARHELVPGSTGYAHFFEHLMFHGTPTMSADEREVRLLELAVSENAWTSSDMTCYHLQAPSRHLPELLAMEADRFANLTLEEEGVRREAGAVLGEFRKGRSDPSEQLYEALWSTAFTTHSYSHTTIGIEEDIRAMPEGMETALTFFRTHYRPDNAILVIAGDVDPAEVMATVAQTHGPWQPQPDAPERMLPPAEPPQEQTQRVELNWTEGPTNPKLSVGWKAPAWSPEDPDVAALFVARELLASEVASFRTRVVDDEALAWELWSWGPQRADLGLLEMHIELREGVAPDAVEAILEEELAVLAEAEDLEERVAAVRGRLRRSLVLGLGDPSSWAFAAGEATLRTGTPSGLDASLAALEAVTVDDVRRVLGTWLVPEQKTVAVLTPVPADAPAEEADAVEAEESASEEESGP